MAKKAYIGVGGVARKVKKGYVGVKSKKYTLKNIAPAINGTTGFNAGSASTTHTKYASSSLMLTGSTSTTEVTATSTASYPLVKGHKYYARVEIYQENVVGSSDFYWPIAEPSFYAGKVATAGQWTIISKTSTRSDWSSGSYQLRLDFNNVSNAGYMWFDGLMLIDLTEAFGEGNEPSVSWLDENLTYFSNKMSLEYPVSDSVARKVIKGYIGDANNIARQIWQSIFTWNKYNVNATTTYYWEKYELASQTIYTWKKYSVSSSTTYSESTSSTTGTVSTTKSSTVYVRKTFNASMGWTFYTTTAGGLRKGDYFTTSSSSSTVYYFYSWASSSSIQYTRKITLNKNTTYSQGSYISDVTSTSSSAYPNNGKSGSYWYVYQSSSTNTVAGAYIGDISSTDSGAYPSNGVSGSYWYKYSTSDTVQERGALLETVESFIEDAYPEDGVHTDGYWYVKLGA